MTRWGYGLVIGKFRPPHKGHGVLIRAALAQSERVMLIVCADASDPIPAELRATWLRELFPSIDVRVYDTTGTDPDDSRYWAAQTIAWLGHASDVVFTSEGYGDAYARYLGAAHVCVDRARTEVPISASRILANPLAYLDYLEPCVRAYFVLRVALVGAESTGETTLARRLAEHYRTRWVPEYGRTYTDGMHAANSPVDKPHDAGGRTADAHARGAVARSTADFLYIADAQQRIEEMLARHANRILICDTDAFTTSLWHERYVGVPSAAVRARADGRRYALTLLAADDIPWHDDGTRDRADERPWFQRRFVEELRASGRPFTEVSGSLN